MSTNIYFEERAIKKTQNLIFLKVCYFVMGSSIDMNVGVFTETSFGFLKSVVFQLFPKYSQSYANFNVKSRPKLNSPWKIGCLSVFHLNVIVELYNSSFTMGLVNFMTFNVLKILENLFSMENFTNAKNCWYKQNLLVWEQDISKR